MRDDFAVFILSHGRAGEVRTLDVLKKAGYTGRWYIIVDDLDEQLGAYKEKYGDNVIVFDKRAWAETTDTMTVTDELKSVVFARNATFEIAKKLGLEYFTEFDDDMTAITIRFEDDGKLRSCTKFNADDLFEATIDFLQNEGISAVGFGLPHFCIGGAEGRFKNKLERQAFGFYFFKTSKPFMFKGITNEDMNTVLELNRRGDVILGFTEIIVSTPERSTNTGGNFDLYKSMTKYVRNFYPVMIAPDCIKIKPDFEIIRSFGNMYPMIINERWKRAK